MQEVLKDRVILSLKGSDALKFIQNFSSNNIEKITFSYNYLLNNQGRYLFDFFAFKLDNNAIYLDCHREQKTDLIARLNLYKLRSDVIITDESNDFMIIYSNEPINTEDIRYSYQDPRYSKLGYRSLAIKSDNYNSVPGLYMEDKYKYTIIDGCIDLVVEKSIPIEFAAEEQQALSFNKGCYVGQEVISRAKSQGVIRKKIYQLEFGTNIALSLRLADIKDNAGNKIGKICSNYKNLAIAQIREEKLLGLSEKKAIIDGNMAHIIDPEWKSKGNITEI